MVQVHDASPAVAIVATGSLRATRQGVKQAPLAPGCYIFRDAGDAPLYVGKSVALRTRLASYFLPNRDGKTRAMLRHARLVEWQMVGSEVEALILESQLVKRLQPPYNVLLREYPHYTFLRLAAGGGFAHLEQCQAVEPDGTDYFGPFWGSASAEQTMEFVNRLFALRRCTGPLPEPEIGRGCFYAQTRKCSAPCLGATSSEAYQAQVHAAVELLRGDVERLLKRLERERDAAAGELRFERAAELQQTIVTLQALRRKRQHLRSAATTVNFLVVVCDRDRAPPGAQVLAFSAARLRGQLHLTATDSAAGAAGVIAEDDLVQFLMVHFPARRELAIDLDELDQMHVVAEWLSRRGRRATYVPLPDRPLSMRDARRAAAAVAQIVSG